MFKCCKKLLGLGVIATLVVGVLGFITFGTSFGSYIRTSIGMVKEGVKDSIPIELEIRRAKDLIEDIDPEMRANLRLVASEEVEVANLEKEIDNERDSVNKQRAKLQRLREVLRSEQVSYRFGTRDYQRTELVSILSTQLSRLQTAEKFLFGKEELLRNRRASLAAAVKNLEKTRLARVELAAKIESLQEQLRLMKLKSSTKDFRLDDTKLAQAQKLIAEIKQRLEVEEKVMASEARFIDMEPLDSIQIDEESVMDRVDNYMHKNSTEEVPETGVATRL